MRMSKSWMITGGVIAGIALDAATLSAEPVQFTSAPQAYAAWRAATPTEQNEIYNWALNYAEACPASSVSPTLQHLGLMCVTPQQKESFIRLCTRYSQTNNSEVSFAAFYQLASWHLALREPEAALRVTEGGLNPPRFIHHWTDHDTCQHEGVDPGDSAVKAGRGCRLPDKVNLGHFNQRACRPAHALEPKGKLPA